MREQTEKEDRGKTGHEEPLSTGASKKPPHSSNLVLYNPMNSIANR